MFDLGGEIRSLFRRYRLTTLVETEEVTFGLKVNGEPDDEEKPKDCTSQIDSLRALALRFSLLRKDGRIILLLMVIYLFMAIARVLSCALAEATISTAQTTTQDSTTKTACDPMPQARPIG